MNVKARRSIANVLGVITVAYLLFLWTIVLNSLRWTMSFPGGLRGGAATMLLAIAASILAATLGKRAWLILVAASVLTFIYVGFFYKMPFWY